MRNYSQRFLSTTTQTLITVFNQQIESFDTYELVPVFCRGRVVAWCELRLSSSFFPRWKSRFPRWFPRVAETCKDEIELEDEWKSPHYFTPFSARFSTFLSKKKLIRKLMRLFDRGLEGKQGRSAICSADLWWVRLVFHSLVLLLTQSSLFFSFSHLQAH